MPKATEITVALGPLQTSLRVTLLFFGVGRWIWFTFQAGICLKNGEGLLIEGSVRDDFDLFVGF